MRHFIQSLPSCFRAARFAGAILIGTVASLLAGGGEVRAETPVPLTAGLEFNGGAGQVVLDDGFSLAERSFTVEAWIWLDNTIGDQPILAQMGEADLLHFIVRSGRLQLGFWNDDLTGGTVLPTGEWLHIAYSYEADSRLQRVYLDGVLDGERTGNAQFAENNLPLRIGRYHVPHLAAMRGRMLEMRIWDHARSGADILAGRFATPPTDAPGLDALFTFEGIVGSDVPEATGQLTGNVLSDAAVVAPVLPPALLNEATLITDVPAGNLAAEVADYTVSPAPTAPYTDAGGAELTDGLGPRLVWGAPWSGFSEPLADPLVVWENPTAELSFSFQERVRIDTLTLYAANSGGADSVALPASVDVSSPGGFAASFPVVADAEVGTLQAVALPDLGLVTDEVTLTLHGSAARIALAEVTFDGAPLAERPADNDGLSLAAQRYLGLDPELDDRSTVQLDVEQIAGETRFSFPVAADNFGATAAVEWSTDLKNWQPVAHEASAVNGRKVARLVPPPADGAAFFRFQFGSEFSEVNPAAALDLGEKATPFSFPAGTFFATADEPEGLGGLTLLALNDRTALVGESITLDFGGTLQIAADGSGTLTVPASMPGGATLEEALTYTVINRLGETVRHTLAFTVTGENDAPTVDDFSGAHTAPAVDAGIAYRYFEGAFADEASLLAATPTETGRVPTFSLDPAQADDYGLEFTGQLFVPAAGPYTFYLGGHDSAVLDLGETRVIGLDPAAPADSERSGTITLEAGTHPIRLRYFATDAAADLSLDYAGPGLRREPLPASAFPRLADLLLVVASDVDTGDTLRISHINGVVLADAAPAILPSGATLSIEENGQITYQPAPGSTVFHEATSSDNFSFTVSDGGGLTATATAQVQLARQNTAPVADGSTRLSADDPANRGSLSLDDRFSDADGDPLRIIAASDAAFLGADVLTNTLPSTAKLSLQHNEGQRSLNYDGWGAFVRTQSGGERYIDSFTLTAVDSAGATAELPVWIDDALGDIQWIVYSDHRLESAVPLRTVRLKPRYNFPITAEIYLEHRDTGAKIGRLEYTLPIRPATVDITFDLPEGEGLEEDELFDSYDLHINTLDGDPIYYAYPPLSEPVTPLYSTYSRSFFAYKGAASPYWPIEIDNVDRGRRPLPNGAYIRDFPYGSILELREKGIVRAAKPANKRLVEPTFAANIIIEGVCRTDDIARFTAQNLNAENIVLTVGNELKEVSVPAGQTVEFEVSYLPRVPVKLREAELGIFDSSVTECPTIIDLDVVSFCSSTFTSFTEVINNGPEPLTVRLQSTVSPSLVSESVTIEAGREETIKLNPEGNNIGGTGGKVVVFLPEGPVDGPTFTFSTQSCN